MWTLSHPLYFSGDSYAGHYIPSVIYHMLHEKKISKKKSGDIALVIVVVVVVKTISVRTTQGGSRGRIQEVMVIIMVVIFSITIIIFIPVAPLEIFACRYWEWPQGTET